MTCLNIKETLALDVLLSIVKPSVTDASASGSVFCCHLCVVLKIGFRIEVIVDVVVAKYFG